MYLRPRKVIQAEENIGCDTEKLYSRQRWCLGVMNAEFIWNDLTGDASTDILPEACDLANPDNWKNGAYNNGAEAGNNDNPCYVLGSGKETDYSSYPPTATWTA